MKKYAKYKLTCEGCAFHDSCEWHKKQIIKNFAPYCLDYRRANKHGKGK